MSGAQQVTFMNQRSFGLIIGQAYGGGFYAGQISTTGDGVATHNLVIGPASSAMANRDWKTTATDTAGTSSDIDGPTNSSNMNDASHPAAQFCESLTIGGFSDWYMPAANELEVCYFNLKPTTLVNNTSSGINANAVPARASNYTSDTPPQTSATIFRDTEAESFGTPSYWSSTQAATVTRGRVQAFDNGDQATSLKDTSNRVRAVRRVPV